VYLEFSSSPFYWPKQRSLAMACMAIKMREEVFFLFRIFLFFGTGIGDDEKKSEKLHVESKNLLTNLGQNKSGNVFLLIEHKIAEKHL
jgi:hypothetical protein